LACKIQLEMLSPWESIGGAIKTCIKHKNPPGSGFLCIEGWESI